MGTLKGILAFTFYLLNTLVWFVFIMFFSLLKLIPVNSVQKLTSYILDFCASSWISVNTLNQKIFTNTRFNVSGLEQLTNNDWYLVVANHQSWVDILVLQRVLNNKIPFLKFFLKKELIYVPFLGLAWWALDFPFMQRYSRKFLQKHPHLKGKDIETTRKACEKFRHKPVSVMNFLEGTRFTEAKHEKSEFDNLLTPKAGGIAFVLSAMGDTLKQIVDVTILYPEGRPNFWQFLKGEIGEVHVDVNLLPIEKNMIGDYFSDEAFRAEFQQQVNQLWRQKDQRLTEMMQASEQG